MRQRFNRSFYIRRIFSSRTDCLYWSLTWENPSGSLQLHMCQFKSNCGHFHLKFHWNLSSTNFEFKESDFKLTFSVCGSNSFNFKITWPDRLAVGNFEVTGMTEKETKKKRNKSVSQFVGCPAAPPAGNSATKRPMDQSCPCAAPDSRQLSRPMAPTAIDCHFTSTSNFKSNLLACAKKVTFYHRNSGRIPEIGIKWTPLNLRIMTVKCALPEMHSNSVQLDGQLSTKKSIPVTCVPQIALLAPLWSYPPHGGVLSGNSLFRPDCVTVSQALRYRHFLINSGGTSDSTEIVNLIAIFSRI